jgi:quinol monooxygenase YgiN
MGSPLSGLIAEAVLHRLEQDAFSKYYPKVWIRYVDDTFVVIKREKLEEFMQTINSVFPDIQFTMEKELNNHLAFLDILITRQENGCLQTSVYRKTTDTMQILHYKSNHPAAHKRSCVRTLFKRVATHCSSEEAKKTEREYLLKLFLSNGYPRSFIRNAQRKRTTEQSNIAENTRHISLPYISNVSDAAGRMLRKYGIQVAHRPNATMRTKVMQAKDRLRPEDKSNIIYDIKCNDCPQHYVGETSKQLKSRLHEHQLCVRRKDHLSLVAQHSYENEHTFNFNDTEVISQARNKSSRLFKEAWLSDEYSINRHINLPPAYQALRHEIKRKKYDKK